MEKKPDTAKATLISYIMRLPDLPDDVRAELLCEVLDGKFVPIHKYNNLLEELKRAKAERDKYMPAWAERQGEREAGLFIAGLAPNRYGPQTENDECRVLNFKK
jgi:hypothetical protein